MVDKNVRLKSSNDEGGFDYLYPATKSEIVDVNGKNLDTTLNDLTDTMTEQNENLTSKLAQTANSNDNLLTRTDTRFQEYQTYRATLDYSSFDDDEIYVSSEGSAYHHHIRTPPVDLKAGREYTLTFELEPITPFTVMNRMDIFSSAGSIVESLPNVTIDSTNYKTYTLTFTPQSDYNNASVGIGRIRSGETGIKESFKIRDSVRLQEGGLSINPKYNEAEKKMVLNKLPQNERLLIHNGATEGEHGGYASFGSGVFFKGKEYHVYRIAAEHVDRVSIENGFGKIMFLIRHEDGRFEKRLLDLPTDLAYRDPWLGVSPDGRRLLLKVCANEGQDMFDSGGDRSTVRYLICYWVLDENLNGLNTSGNVTSLTTARHILWDGRTDSVAGLQYHAYGSVVFNPGGNMLTTAYNGYDNYGVDVLKSPGSSYLNPGKLTKTETLFPIGEKANETTLFYWKGRLCAVTRIGGSGDPELTVFKSTEDLYDGREWGPSQNFNTYLFSPAVVGSYITDDKVILFGSRLDNPNNTRRPVYYVLTLNRQGDLKYSGFVDIDEKIGSGGYPSIVKTKNGYSSIYYEDVVFGRTRLFYKEFDIDTNYIEYFTDSTAFPNFKQTTPNSGIKVKIINLGNMMYEVFGTCQFTNIIESTFSRNIDLPFPCEFYAKTSNVYSEATRFVSNIEEVSSSTLKMNVIRVDKTDTLQRTPIAEFRCLVKRVF